VYFAIVRLVGIGSLLACTIVIASFSLFAVNETSTASTHQQQELKAETAPSTTAAPSQTPARSHESSVRKAIDEASEWLTSPFSGLTSGSHSEWAVRSIDLVLALFVYGFCVGFLRRMARVRI
jgi:hypothetical protein